MSSTAATEATRRKRAIGPIGTTARAVVGLLLAGSAAVGHWTAGFHADSWLLGLVGFPVVLVALQWARARRHPSRLDATGIVAQVANVAVLLALYLTPSFAPALSATSDAALLFYGGSMLLAATRGYAGCEVLAVSNWLLRRNDQVGCLVFSPLDRLERRWRAHPPHPRPALRRTGIEHDSDTEQRTLPSIGTTSAAQPAFTAGSNRGGPRAAWRRAFRAGGRWTGRPR